MNGALLVLIVLVVAAIGVAVYASSKASGKRSASSLADAKADARRVIERLGGQVLNLTGTDDASKQAMADASERYTAASSAIDQATTAKQALLAKESAIEGLYYVRAARTAMGMDPGPELETLAGQRSAGSVTEDRRVEFEGREIEASPGPSERTPTTTPAAVLPAGRCPPAGTPSLGGSLHWSPAPGAWARYCCSACCFPAWAVSATTQRGSSMARVRAMMLAPTADATAAGMTTAAATPAVVTTAGVTAAVAGIPAAGIPAVATGAAAAISAAGTSAASSLRPLKPALQARRHPGLLKVESFQHGPSGFILDPACVAFGDQRGALGHQHVAVQRREHLRAQRV